MAVSAKVASAYIDLVARTEAFQKAMNDATGMMRKFSAETKAQMAEARGAIMLLGESLGVHIPRHLQAVIAKLPGVAIAMNAAFSSVAVLAAGEVIFETGKKIYEFCEKSEEAAKKNEEAYRSLSESLEKQNLQLQIGNDKLDEKIAKLEHKPNNSLKTALDEARQSTFDLSVELDKAITKERELLDAASANFIQKIAGTAGTESVKQGLNSYQLRQHDEDARHKNELDPNSWSVADSLRGHKLSPQAEQLEHEKKITEITEKYYNELAAEIEKRQNYQNLRQNFSKTGMTDEYFQLDREFAKTKSNGDQSKILPALENLKGNIGSLGWIQQGEADRDSKTGKLAHLEAGKAGADAAKKAAEEAAKAAAKAAKEFGDMVMGMVKDNDFRATENERVTEAITATWEKEQKGIEEFDEDLDHSGERWAAYNKEIAKSAEALAIADAQLQERDAKRDLAAGAIGPHAAAILIAQAHVDAYSASIKALNGELTTLRAAGTYVNGINVDPKNAAEQLTVQSKIDNLGGQQKIQALEDAVNEFATSWQGAVDGVFGEVVRKSQETAEQIKQVASGIIDSINNELSKGLTGHKMDFSKVFESGSQQLAKISLQKAEGLGSQLLGLGGGGKLGTKGNPMHVIDANAPPGGKAGSAISGGLLGMLNNSNWASSLFGGRLFGAGSAFGGGKAMGGAVYPGMEYDIGELGRERFVPQVPGRIVPNNQLGGGAAIHMHIDARCTDPSLTRENFQRALTQVHRQAVHDAGMAMMEHNRRVAH
jgi:hypothetical protein